MKIFYTIILTILLSSGLMNAQIVFSYDIDNSELDNIQVNIYARATDADEGLLAYTTAFYYNSADVFFEEYDEAPAQAIGWSTAGNFTISDVDRNNTSIPIDHNKRIELQQIDGNFAGAVISSTPVHIGTLVFATTAPRGFLAVGDIYMPTTDEDGSSIAYINTDFVDSDIAVEGAPLQNLLLPVNFSFFKASKQEDFSALSWQTSSETNNDYFNVERSADGKSFETIGKVAGNGTTTETQNYEFLDRTPHTGLNYYRLKQVDFNGAFEYSKIETVDFRDGTEGDVSIFPNPSVDYVQVSLDRAYDGVRVTNQLGQLVEVLPASLYESNQFKMDISHYSPGVYFLEARLGNEIVNKQFVKVK